MRFVLDASVAIAWVMRDEDHPLADLALREIRSGSAVVPGIWWYELRNILVVNERRSRISVYDSDRFVQSPRHLSIDVAFPQNSSETLRLSRKHKLSVYDAAYLAVAMAELLPLSTLDKYLATSALSEGVALLE
jgi:predicted nucleic acid-binding protein